MRLLKSRTATAVSPVVGWSSCGRLLAALGVCVALADRAAFAQPGASPMGGAGGGAAGGNAGGAAGSPAVEALQGSLLTDSRNRDEVLSLEDDPLVQDILRDEDTMHAIQSGDLEQLLANPKVRALAAHPTVKGIIERQTR